MKMQGKPLGIRIFTVPVAILVVWLWVSFFRFQPDDPRDFSTVTGVLVSAKEHISRGSGRLEIRLQGSAVRYSVAGGGYLPYFRRKAFFAEVGNGDTIELTARTSEIANPRTFLLNSTPTVFVDGVRAGGRDYYTIQDEIAWQKSNHWWALGAAIASSGFLAYLLLSHRWRRSPSPVVSPVSGEPPTLRNMAKEVLSPGYYGRARQRAQRRVSLWNSFLLTVMFGAFLPIFGALFWVMWHIHTAIYPSHAGKFGDFLNGDTTGVLAIVSSFLLFLPLGFAALPLSMILANVAGWCIPPARRAFEREAQGVKGATFRDAMSGIWKISLIMVSICLLLSFIGAATLTSLK
ncbi:MAG: hypothetical protein ACLQLG_00330 [Thermoguttaceae bacterium]